MALAPKPEDITPEWTFGGTWDPESTRGPRIVKVDRGENEIRLTFDEDITVKGSPRLMLPAGRRLRARQTARTLIYRGSAIAAPPSRLPLEGGVIIASMASSKPRVARMARP